MRRLGGETAGSAVAAALANMLAPPKGSEQPVGPEQPGSPEQPGTSGTPGATEGQASAGDPGLRVVSGAEAAEFMREFFGGSPPAGERPTDEG